MDETRGDKTMRQLVLAAAAVCGLITGSGTTQATLLFDNGTGNFTSFPQREQSA
jgi:hypothetical protein